MGGKNKTTQTSKREMPAYVRQGNEALVGRAQDILNRDYTAFNGPRVAGISQNEQMATDMARNNAGLSQGYVQQGADALGRLTSWDKANVGAYMNPYVENVLNNQQRGLNRQFEGRQSELARTSGMRGAFGGGRQSAMESQLAKDQLETTGDMWGQGYKSAFDNAGQMWSQDQNRLIAEAGAYGNLAGTSDQSTRTNIQNLTGTGMIGRGIDQAQMDVNYADFIERRDWDVNNMGPLLQAMSVAPGAADTKETTTTETKQSKLGSALGLAATVGGFMATGGMSSLGGLIKAGVGLLGSQAGGAGGSAGGQM